MVKVNPTILARELLGQENIIAESSGGDFIMIYPCKKISNMSWRKVTECYKNIPVTFSIDKNKYQGFYNPITKIIAQKSPKVLCDKARGIFFMVNKKLFRFKPGHYPTEIATKIAQTLPVIANKPEENIIELPTNFIYNESINAGNEMIWEYMDIEISDLKEKTAITNEIQKTDWIAALGFDWTSTAKLLGSVNNIIYKIFSIMGFIAFWSITVRPRIKSWIRLNTEMA